MSPAFRKVCFALPGLFEKCQVIHGLFRTCEVVSRLSIFIMFMVMCRASMKCWWWWWLLPLATEYVTTLSLLIIHGGSERSGPIRFLVRILCSIPCMFVNIFLFVDSPVKRRAASRLSWWLTVRHLLELVVLPLIAVYGPPQQGRNILQFRHHHPITTIGSLIAIPLYWPLLWWVTSSRPNCCFEAEEQIVDIFSACEAGNVSQVRLALRALTHSSASTATAYTAEVSTDQQRGGVGGLNINLCDIDGCTPLMLAAYNGHTQVCRLLKREGARVDIQACHGPRISMCWSKAATGRGWTALHYAAEKGHVDTLRVLLQCRGVDSVSGFRDSRGNTPMHVAAERGHVEIVSELFSKHPSWVHETNDRQNTPTDVASTTELRRQLEELVEAVRHGDFNGRTAPLLRSAVPVSVPSALADGPDEVFWPQVNLSIARTSGDDTHTVSSRQIRQHFSRSACCGCEDSA